ncbi:DNA-binding protein [Balneolaceae bacterium YR4-1]|uniref:DNA-binding protein n=1 Tax=Halalkalibaculum roseum TaxID=2709311 RepID=A0A6M1SUJ8_9BACT|nr:DNA-binding protein [Halalkalibaculum roseum]NGP76590.1 DNA-binding protein [Halalkalibaculum roseum]
MKQLLYTGLAFLVALSIVPDLAIAQQKGNKMKKQMYSRNFDANSMETIEGEVAEVTIQTGNNNMGTPGVHIVVKTKETTIPVHLGPVWYMEQQEYSFEKGDKVTVYGSRITYDGAPAIIAVRVNRGDMLLQLRNRQGIPNWRGWRMGSGRIN